MMRNRQSPTFLIYRACLISLFFWPLHLPAFPISVARENRATLSSPMAFQLPSLPHNRRAGAYPSPRFRFPFGTDRKNRASCIQMGSELNQDAKPRAVAPVTIERVSTMKRALDVHVYRKWSIPAKELMQRQAASEESTAIMNEEDAIIHLMKGYGSDGKRINHLSKHDPVVHFAAALYPLPSSLSTSEGRQADDLSEPCYARQNGVVGAVDTQLRNQDSDVTVEDMRRFMLSSALSKPDDECVQSLPEASLPPYIYLFNMEVDEQMRGQGIGAALVSAVSSYVRTQTPASMVLLSVENDNHAAIRAYFREGYDYLEKNEVFGKMFKIP